MVKAAQSELDFLRLAVFDALLVLQANTRSARSSRLLAVIGDTPPSRCLALADNVPWPGAGCSPRWRQAEYGVAVASAKSPLEEVRDFRGSTHADLIISLRLPGVLDRAQGHPWAHSRRRTRRHLIDPCRGAGDRRRSESKR